MVRQEKEMQGCTFKPQLRKAVLSISRQEKADEDGDRPAYRPRTLLKSNTQRAIRGEDKYVQRQLEAQRRREQKKQALENLGKPRSVARAVLQPRAAQARHQDSTETHAQDFS